MTKDQCLKIYDEFWGKGDLKKVLDSHGATYDDWLDKFEEIYPDHKGVEYKGLYVFDLAWELFKGGVLNEKEV